MANVRLIVGGRHYILGCADGDEPELERLATVLDSAFANAKAMIGEAGEARLLVLAGLLLADRVGSNVAPAVEDPVLEDAAARVRQLTARVAAVTDRLSAATGG